MSLLGSSREQVTETVKWWPPERDGTSEWGVRVEAGHMHERGRGGERKERREKQTLNFTLGTANALGKHTSHAVLSTVENILQCLRQ